MRTPTFSRAATLEEEVKPASDRLIIAGFVKFHNKTQQSKNIDMYIYIYIISQAKNP